MTKIKAGDYIRHVYETETCDDDVPKTELEEILEEESPKKHDENKTTDYYLVLDVDAKNVEIIIFGGTPFDKKTIHDYGEVKENYTLIDVGEDVVKVQLYNEYYNHDLDRYIYAGTKYIWHEKELFISASDHYFNGRGYEKSPEGFYGELKRSLIDLNRKPEKIKGE